MRIQALFRAVLSASGHALALDDANRVTIPTAASIVGVSPFFSDVRVFNTSYESTISLEATYRCFVGTCPDQAPAIEITVAPRETKPFNDIVAGAFAAPNSAGGIEFEAISGGTAADVGISSRLYSTAPTPTVGMLVPGVLSAEAGSVTFLEQISNGGLGQGFRTNAGAFNGGDVAVNARFDVFDSSGELFGTVSREIAAHSGAQINNIFGAIGRGSESTDDALIVVTSTGDVFSYAAVIDNETTDPFLVVGAHDVPAPPDHVPPPAPTETPTQQPPPPTPTPAPQGQTAIVNVGQGGLNFVDQASGSNMTTIHVGDTVRWVWSGGFHSTTSGSCGGGCRPDGQWDSGEGSGLTFSRSFTQPGTFQYYCTVHGSSMTGVVRVQ